MEALWKAAEESKWWDERNHRCFYMIYDGNTPIGYTITMQEADAICEKYPRYQWDVSKKKRHETLLTLSQMSDT